MSHFEPLDPAFPVSRQMDVDAGPIVLINLCTMAPEDEAAFLAAWTQDSLFMNANPVSSRPNCIVHLATTRPTSTTPSSKVRPHGATLSRTRSFRKSSRPIPHRWWPVRTCSGKSRYQTCARRESRGANTNPACMEIHREVSPSSSNRTPA